LDAQILPGSTFAYAAPTSIVRTHLPVPSSGVAEWSIRFTSPATGHTIEALLFAPSHLVGRHGAALFVHWLGPLKLSNAEEFAPDAIALARHGVTSLSIQAPWSQSHWFNQIRNDDTDYAMSIGIVQDWRAGLDLLSHDPHVDARDIAFVGHDFGAMYGAVLSAVDDRPKYYVLVAGNDSLTQWFLLDRRKPSDLPAYTAQMSALEPTKYLAVSHAAGYFFQFARQDEYIAPDHALAFFAAAPTPRTMAIYSTDHAMQSNLVFNDRLSWLLQRLR
jgi:cephalosporin-C deacetylase-like acetyl esterase